MKHAWLPAAAAFLLGGCSSAGGFAGAAASIAVSVATANPIVGVSVGIGVKAAADEAIRTAGRRRAQTEQDAIAAAAGDMGPGEVRAWRAAHIAGTGEAHGEVHVVRAIATPLAVCKEIVFSVEEAGKTPSRSWFATSACREGETWKWAAVEPAVGRWSGLQ